MAMDRREDERGPTRNQAVGKEKKKVSSPRREVSLHEGNNCIDVMDELERQIGTLREIIQLLHVASLHREGREIISLSRITEDMLHRLAEIKKLSQQLLEHCQKGV